MQLGRRGDQDIVVPEATVSGAHAMLRWQAGSWIIEDRGSTNGTYADHSYERKTQVALMHGGEVQIGELRLKLVSFQPDSPQHQRAQGVPRQARRPHRASVARPPAAQPRRRGVVRRLGRGADDRRALRAARAQPPGIDRPTILEMLALRRAAQRVVELTEMLLLVALAGRRRAHRAAQVRGRDGGADARRGAARRRAGGRAGRRACCPKRSSSA